jgi:hypothetical protein
LLVAVMTLTAGCPLIIPLGPARVGASHGWGATAELRSDEGVVVIASEPEAEKARELEGKVVSCVQDALVVTQRARVIVADKLLREALGDMSAQQAFDPSVQEYVTSRKLRYALRVWILQEDSPRHWQAGGGGGAGIAMDHDVSYALRGSVVDLANGETIGSAVATTRAKSGLFSWLPLFVIWTGHWTSPGKVCQEFGQEVATLLRDDRPTDHGGPTRDMPSEPSSQSAPVGTSSATGVPNAPDAVDPRGPRGK